MHSIDFVSPNPIGGINPNIFNWYTKLELVCMENKKARTTLALIAISALVGISVSCLFIPRMGDLYGRKPLYVFALTL